MVRWLRSFVWLWLSIKETPKNDKKKKKPTKKKTPKKQPKQQKAMYSIYRKRCAALLNDRTQRGVLLKAELDADNTEKGRAVLFHRAHGAKKVLSWRPGQHSVVVNSLRQL